MSDQESPSRPQGAGYGSEEAAPADQTPATATATTTTTTTTSTTADDAGVAAPSLRVAVVGAGVSGLSAAYHLVKYAPPGSSVQVTIFESRHKVGGHAFTYGADDHAACGTGELPVDVPNIDAGFMVCNETTYPNLMRFFRDFNVALDPTDMGFCVADAPDDPRARTWSFGKNASAWIRMLFMPRFWRWIGAKTRFHTEALEYLADPSTGGEAIGEWLDARSYDPALTEDWILPFCAAVWSKPLAGAREMDAKSLFGFLRNHGFLSWSLPQWYTPKNRCGSAYLPRLRAWLDAHGVNIKTNAKISGAVREQQHSSSISSSSSSSSSRVRLSGPNGEDMGAYDDVIFATPAGALNDTLAELAPEYASFLPGFRTNRADIYVHSDETFMPNDRTWWTSWTVQGSVLTYWLNNLQHLETERDVFETLNPTRTPKHVHAKMELRHPIMDAAAIKAQKAYRKASQAAAAAAASRSSSSDNGGSDSDGSGSRRAGVWLAGAYLHHGFHEGGFRSGIEAARRVLGRDHGGDGIPLLPVPYARIHPRHHVYTGTTTHVRARGGVKRSFSYNLHQHMVDVDGHASYWWGGLRREDHFGDPDVPLGEALRQRVCAETGVYPSGAIDFCGHLSTYGYAFNPICLYFCWGGELGGERQHIDFIVAQVTNTPWGQRTVHVLDLRDNSSNSGSGSGSGSGSSGSGSGSGSGRGYMLRLPLTYVRTKSLHVSPFNPVPDGEQLWEYRFEALPGARQVNDTTGTGDKKDSSSDGAGGGETAPATKKTSPPRVKLSVTLFDNAEARAQMRPTIIAKMDVRRTAESAPWLPRPESLIIQAQIHWQAVLIFAAGLKFVPNTTCPVGRTSPQLIQRTLALFIVTFALCALYAGVSGMVTLAAGLGLLGWSVVRPMHRSGGGVLLTPPNLGLNRSSSSSSSSSSSVKKSGRKVRVGTQ
eukprot:UC1_evm1s1026